MADNKKIIYTIEVTDKGTYKIRELNAEVSDSSELFNKLTADIQKNATAGNLNASAMQAQINQLKQLRDQNTTANDLYRKQTAEIRTLEGEYKKLTAVTNQQTDKTGLASATLVEFSRGVQDANYGFRGVANNLSQLTTLMTTLIGTTGGLKNAWAALVKAFTGPIGFLVVANIIIAALERLSIMTEKNTKKTEENTKAIKDNIKEREKQLGQLKTNIDLLTDEFEQILERGAVGVGGFIEQERALLVLQALLTEAGIKEGKLLSDKNLFLEDRLRLGLALYQREKQQLELDQLVLSLEGEISDTQKRTILNNIGAKKEQIQTNQNLIDSIVEMQEVEVESEKEKNKTVEQLEREKLQFKKEVGDALAVWEEQQFLLERQRLEDHYEKLIEQTKKNGESTIGLELAKFAALKQIDDERRLQIEQEQEKKDADAEREVLREIRINKAKNKAKDDQLRYEQEIELARVGFAKQISGIFAAIGKEGSGLAKTALLLEKGAAIADIIIKSQQSIATQKAAAAAYTLQTRAAFAAGGPIGLAAGEALIKRNQVSLLKNISQTKIGAGLSIAKIVATSLSNKGGSVAASVPSSAEPSAPQIQAPAFNVVGATQESQLAQTISQAEQQPIKAFVVASDVSTAQELERSTIEGASIG
jgi:hypothetical protein